jgi:hypothetical protein
MRRRLLLALAAAGGTLLVAAGCGPVDVTRSRLEAQVGPTFRNMYVLQQHLLGHTELVVPARTSAASCIKGSRSTPDSGPGDWTCQVHWPAPDGQLQTLSYDVKVQPVGCYTAQGPALLVGAQYLHAVNGRTVPNPLYEFDGCLRL